MHCSVFKPPLSVAVVPPEMMQTGSCRWEDITKAVQDNVEEDVVLDASLHLLSTANSSATTESIRSTVAHAVVMPGGGYVANRELVFGHGTETSFPPGVYMQQIVVTDDHGLTGHALLGACSEKSVQEMLPWMPSLDAFLHKATIDETCFRTNDDCC